MTGRDTATRHIGLFGGSFDPVHRGHLLAAQSVQQQLSLDSLVWLPAAQSPFKAAPASPDRHRIAMLRLAIEAYPQFKLDTRELLRSGPSYSIDTLSEIVAEQPQNHYYLLMGVDAWVGFEQWYRWQSIVDLCNLVVVTRPAYERPLLSSGWQKKCISRVEDIRSRKTGGVIFLSVPESPAASSDIRQRLQHGKPVDGLLSPQVQSYIAEHGLYQP